MPPYLSFRPQKTSSEQKSILSPQPFPIPKSRRFAELDSLPDTFHQDPADRLIIATARSLKIPLATQDRKITTSRLTRI
jgi:PIN domain nuclease of toxin-antitoxin system